MPTGKNISDADQSPDATSPWDFGSESESPQPPLLSVVQATAEEDALNIFLPEPAMGPPGNLDRPGATRFRWATRAPERVASRPPEAPSPRVSGRPAEPPRVAPPALRGLDVRMWMVGGIFGVIVGLLFAGLLVMASRQRAAVASLARADPAGTASTSRPPRQEMRPDAGPASPSVPQRMAESSATVRLIPEPTPAERRAGEPKQPIERPDVARTRTDRGARTASRRPTQPAPSAPSSPGRRPEARIESRPAVTDRTPSAATSPIATPSPPADAPIGTLSTTGMASVPGTAATTVPTPPPARSASVSPSPAAPPAAAPVVSVPAAPGGDESAVRNVLGRYVSAYESLNVNAAKAVWPSVDTKALGRAFAGLESQELSFSNCEVSVNNASARAVCGGTARFVPRVGNRSEHLEYREWRFDMRKTDQRWTIDHVQVR